MKKFLKSLFISLLFVLVIPSTIWAREIIREENGERCLDLEAAYADINDSSKALTGQDNSVDAIKKTQTLASLTNLISILVGNGIYCINDELAASRTSSLGDYGLIGELSSANSQMLAYFPSINVGQHLAEEFIPGYKDNVGIYADQACEDKCVNMYGTGNSQYLQCQGACKTIDSLGNNINTVDLEEFFLEADLKKFNEGVGGKITKRFDKQGTEIVQEATQDIDDYEQSAISSKKITKSGYSYLKDNLHLDTIWGIFRNIAYLSYVVILIIIGFMIMFRKNLPGQVIVSIGNTIPQLVLGIVLVTFSFAIVGLVMDIGKVSMVVVGDIFENAYSEAGSQVDQNDIISIEGVGSLTNQAIIKAKKDGIIVSQVRKIPFIGGVLANLVSSTGGTLYSLAIQIRTFTKFIMIADATQQNDISIDTGFLAGLIGVETISDIAIEIGEMLLDWKLGGVVKVALMTLIVRNVLLCLVCLYASFKLFVTMLMTYLKLFMNVVFGPIQIMLGSLPGNFSSTTKWFKSVIANVFVFVGIFLVVNLFAFLSHIVDPSEFNFFGNKGVFWPDWIVSLEGVILIAGYLFASNMPTIINGALKIEQSKEMSMVGQSVQKAAGKIPLIGGMFNG